MRRRDGGQEVLDGETHGQSCMLHVRHHDSRAVKAIEEARRRSATVATSLFLLRVRIGPREHRLHERTVRHAARNLAFRID